MQLILKRQGPVWANSLLEDKTEYGFGMLISRIQRRKRILDIDNKVGSISNPPHAVNEVEQYCIAIVKPTEKLQQIIYELKKSIEVYETETPILADLYKILNSEVNSNTKGMMLQATQLDASVKFASTVKKTTKKNLKYFLQYKKSKRFPSPSIITEYAPFLNHEIKEGHVNMIQEDTLAVKYWYWTLFRDNSLLVKEGKNPFQLRFNRSHW
ncbi:MAG: Pyruvate-ferrodoxin oxidoreductase [Streblomastix strix]|uniref:Pyruvate-ferrodoxin oxidoreductase n=1 Tax=Streblomastix strix TaxID=222440 RepID=A0A5J4X1K2_9EUKA|nr:MAG: Pyruvate-ferrodoxin oxidoreductase [Streblomastix strix]